MRPDLLKWQWDGYPDFHRSKTNLLIHIVAVPAFISCTLGVALSLAMLHFISAAGSFVGMAVAFAAQGIGHGKEGNPSIPFDGPGDAVTRIFVEQFVTFPRFVFSGGWANALKSAS